jgi:hypothetical protein
VASNYGHRNAFIAGWELADQMLPAVCNNPKLIKIKIVRKMDPMGHLVWTLMFDDQHDYLD